MRLKALLTVALSKNFVMPLENGVDGTLVKCIYDMLTQRLLSAKVEVDRYLRIEAIETSEKYIGALLCELENLSNPN